MDHLSKVAKEAKECGMSYGMYVAMKYEQNGYRPEEKPSEEDELPKQVAHEFRKCVICGGWLPYGANRRFKTCSRSCSYELNKRSVREFYQNNRKFKPDGPVKCAYCGKEFLQNRRAQRFCCAECREAHKSENRRKDKKC